MKKFKVEIMLFDNVEKEIAKITEKLREKISRDLKRYGAIIGLSGGIDSSLTLALTVKAIGSENIVGLLLPEKDSNPESKLLALKLAEKFGVNTIEENISYALDGLGCYKRRDEAVRNLYPDYDPGIHKMKIGINPEGIKHNLPSIFFLTILDANGDQEKILLPAKEYLQIVAASNLKQRTRMSMLYYHAERLHYAVVGTPNKHEYEQGFFVKYGDGGADIFPIAHLYKTQVYQLAEYMGVPSEIMERTPTTDTYPAEQTQSEFFYQLPFETMDLLWYGFENGYPVNEVASVLGESEEHILAIYSNFNRKRKTTDYLRMQPIRLF